MIPFFAASKHPHFIAINQMWERKPSQSRFLCERKSIVLCVEKKRKVHFGDKPCYRILYAPVSQFRKWIILKRRARRER